MKREIPPQEPGDLTPPDVHEKMWRLYNPRRRPSLPIVLLSALVSAWLVVWVIIRRQGIIRNGAI